MTNTLAYFVQNISDEEKKLCNFFDQFEFEFPYKQFKKIVLTSDNQGQIS
jgi:hypothetical protein